MPFGAALGTRLGRDLINPRIGQFRRDDSGRDSNDCVANYHDNGRQGLTNGRFWGNIAIPHRRQSHDSPVDSTGDAGKTVLSTLNEIHEGAEDDDKGDDGKEEDGNLEAACPQGAHENMGLSEIFGKLENPEDPEHSEGPYDEHELSARYEKAEIGRKDRQDIDEAEEASCVPEWPADTDEAQNILYSEDNGKEPLNLMELLYVCRPYDADAVEHYGYNAQYDA